MLLDCGVWEDSWESLGLQGDPTSPSERRSVLGVYWKDWCWSWSSNTLATWCEELTHWKRPWCWEGLGAGGEGDDRGWDAWMASLIRWTWVWVNSGSWWWTGRPGMLRFMESQRVGHDWATELNWTELNLVVQLLSQVQLFVTPWTAGHQAPLSSTISQSLLKFMSTESVILSNHLILCHPLSFCLQSFPAWGSFPVSQLQSTGASASASVLPMNIQGWFPLGFTSLITFLSKRLSRVFSSTTTSSISSSELSLLYGPTLTLEHDY